MVLGSSPPSRTQYSRSRGSPQRRSPRPSSSIRPPKTFRSDVSHLQVRSLRTNDGFWANVMRIGNSYLDSVGSKNLHWCETSEWISKNSKGRVLSSENLGTIKVRSNFARFFAEDSTLKIFLGDNGKFFDGIASSKSKFWSKTKFSNFWRCCKRSKLFSRSQKDEIFIKNLSRTPTLIYSRVQNFQISLLFIKHYVMCIT